MKKDLAYYEPESENNGCLVIDYSCYFPYANQEDVKLGLKINGEGVGDCKLNHRYPNKDYVTLSKTYGKKVCSHGYPIIIPFNQKGKKIDITIAMTIGKGKTTEIEFPVVMWPTEEKPHSLLRIVWSINEEEKNGGSFYMESSGNSMRPDGKESLDERIWAPKINDHIQTAMDLLGDCVHYTELFFGKKKIIENGEHYLLEETIYPVPVEKGQAEFF